MKPFAPVAFAVAFIVSLTAALPLSAEPSWTTEEVTLGNELYGTLTLPDGDAPADAALIIAGSGPTDRDGNFPGGPNDSLKMLAAELGERGIASLRFDKRGTGESIAAAPSEEKLRAETFVEDVEGWITFLKERPSIRRVVVIGHSEGGLVGTLAAQKQPVAGIVLLASAGRPAPALIREQLAGQDLPPEIAKRAEEILASLERGETVDKVPHQLDALYRPSVQPYLISWFKYDPAEELAKLDVPVLVIQGTRDLQARPADSEKLAAAHDGATLVTIEDMNHVLKTAPESRAGNMALYADPEAPLAGGLSDAIADFIGKMADAPAAVR
ncbi:MAG: alpha/beta fold hydrolase [Parvibaculaceae bacterium]